MGLEFTHSQVFATNFDQNRATTMRYQTLIEFTRELTSSSQAMLICFMVQTPIEIATCNPHHRCTNK